MEASREGLFARVLPLDSVLHFRCLFLPSRSVFRTIVASGERLAHQLECLAHVHCHHLESESPLSCFSLVLSKLEEVVDCLVTFSPESCLIWRLELVEMCVEIVGYQGGDGLVAHGGL